MFCDGCGSLQRHSSKEPPKFEELVLFFAISQMRKLRWSLVCLCCYNRISEAG